MSFQSGYIGVVGRANVGKSTLVNGLFNQKISIVSDKSQTTRNAIRAIKTTDKYQLIYVDTPGMHKPKNVLDQRMRQTIVRSLEELDAILFVIDLSQGFGRGDQYMADLISDKSKCILVLNKIDLLEDGEYQQKLKEIPDLDQYRDVRAMSAIQRESLIGLEEVILPLIPQGPKYYDGDTISDSGFRFTVSEIIREKALNYLDQEVPHGIAVVVESYDQEGSKIAVNAQIIVEKDSHKSIVIGRGGKKIKGIRLAAQKDLRAIYGQTIRLDLFVKVKKDWRNSEYLTSEFGYGDE